MLDLKYLVNENGEKTDVILHYNDFLDLIEEIEDLRTIADRKNEPLIEHDAVIRSLEDI